MEWQSQRLEDSVKSEALGHHNAISACHSVVSFWNLLNHDVLYMSIPCLIS